MEATRANASTAMINRFLKINISVSCQAVPDIWFSKETIQHQWLFSKYQECQIFFLQFL